jgi:hypothetical protein
LDKFLWQRPTYRFLAELRKCHDLHIAQGTVTDGLKRLKMPPDPASEARPPKDSSALSAESVLEGQPCEVEVAQHSKVKGPLSSAQAAAVAKMLKLCDHGDVKISCANALGASKDFEAALALAVEQQLAHHGYLMHVSQIEVRLWLAYLTHRLYTFMEDG